MFDSGESAFCSHCADELLTTLDCFFVKTDQERGHSDPKCPGLLENGKVRNKKS